MLRKFGVFVAPSRVQSRCSDAMGGSIARTGAETGVTGAGHGLGEGKMLVNQ
jgi:hypothetical protein